MTTRVSNLLGTTADVHVGGSSNRRSVKLERSVIDEIRRLESIFNLFDSTSEISRLSADSDNVPSAEFSEVFGLAMYWQHQTGGAFNARTGAVRALWQQAEQVQQMPSVDAAKEAGGQSQLAHPMKHLNLNAIAKGWIVDRAIEAAINGRRRSPSCWVSIGGDVAHQGEGSVNVGVENPLRPFDNASPIQVVKLTNQALATSGGARRYWTIDGDRFSHVIDPRSGWPVDHVASATVIAEDAATADALATAATVLRPNESLALIDATSRTACLLIERDGTIHRSPRWPD